MDSGAELIITPRLRDDVEGRRRAVVHALVRLGRRDDSFVYAPLLVKHSEVVEHSATRSMLATDLDDPTPLRALTVENTNVRGTSSVTRSGIVLSHATRVLQRLGHGDDRGRAGLVDRRGRIWWFELALERHGRFNLRAYDALYDERRRLLDALDAWQRGEGDYPTSPYWHRECVDCAYRDHCHEELDARDDVSLTHYTNFEQQRLLHEFDVHTRHDLATLDPTLARLARRTTSDSSSREAVLGVAIERLDDLIYRARVHVRGSLLRIVESDAVGCPGADVEVDVDMESYGDHTYLWGASVRVAPHLREQFDEGYRAFVEWGELDNASEARVFSEFWSWFDELRSRCHASNVSFAAYCFWAQAEDGAMNRAVASECEARPTREELDAFRRHTPREWIDLHEVAASQVQTAGPLGLKVMARAAGFEWRDENPSGEASMRWYECARDENEDMAQWRQRLLDYNEDDCRATRALRDWLNGDARALPHRDDPVTNA